MIRSGSTVLYQIASGIVELRGTGARCGYYEPPNPPPLPTSTTHNPQPTTLVYKVPWLGDYEKQLIRDGAIAFYSHRYIEDALASMYRAFKIPEGTQWLYRVLTEGHNREMVRLLGNADAVPALHTISFGCIRDHLRDVIVQVAERIPGRELTGDEIDRLHADLSLDRQRARPKVEPYDPHTMLFPQHFD